MHHHCTSGHHPAQWQAMSGRGHRHRGSGRGRRGGGPDGGDYRIGKMLGDGDLKLIVLALLAENPRHGYDIIKALEEKSSGVYSPSPGVVYPTLTFLEEAGYATAVAEGTKKVYSITEEGSAHHRGEPRCGRQHSGRDRARRPQDVARPRLVGLGRRVAGYAEPGGAQQGQAAFAGADHRRDRRLRRGPATADRDPQPGRRRGARQERRLEWRMSLSPCLQTRRRLRRNPRASVTAAVGSRRCRRPPI